MGSGDRACWSAVKHPALSPWLVQTARADERCYLSRSNDERGHLPGERRLLIWRNDVGRVIDEAIRSETLPPSQPTTMAGCGGNRE